MLLERKMKMKMDTINNTIRGEFNKHKIDSTYKDCRHLFERKGQGRYSLTEKARHYNGR